MQSETYEEQLRVVGAGECRSRAGDRCVDADRLVLLHEGLGSVSAWRGFPDVLHRATSRRVIAFSRFGHGRRSLRHPSISSIGSRRGSVAPCGAWSCRVATIPHRDEPESVIREIAVFVDEVDELAHRAA